MTIPRSLIAIIAQQTGGGPPPSALPFSDAFGRTEATGWGNGWNVNTPSIFSVASNRGQMLQSSTSYHRALRGSSELVVDQDMEIQVSAFSDTSTGIELRILSRYQNESNYYAGMVHIRTARISTWIRKRVAGVDSDFGYTFTYINAPSTANTWHVRFQQTGNTSSTTMNLHVGTNADNGTPAATHTDSSSVFAAGDFGIAAYANSGMTNNPTLYVDNYAAT